MGGRRALDAAQQCWEGYIVAVAARWKLTYQGTGCFLGNTALELPGRTLHRAEFRIVMTPTRTGRKARLLEKKQGQIKSSSTMGLSKLRSSSSSMRLSWQRKRKIWTTSRCWKSGSVNF